MAKGQIEFALAHPVFDPMKHIIAGHSWMTERFVSATMPVNIGME